MRLLNLSIGKVQTIRIGADTVRTAHVKAPAPRPWLITEDGALGDERAVHPDKIYAYARTGYDHWGRCFDRDPAAWPDGFFGENLTLDTLDEADIRIGDVFALGDQVRLVVAGPRNPCAKLAWRLGQPPTFQKVFAASGFTGVYFGVLAAGEVRPGDTLRRLEHDPAMPSVAETASFAAGHAVPPLEPLDRLLAFPHLSRTIRHILHARHELAQRAQAAAEGRWRGWRPFTIDRFVDEAAGIRSFHLRPADGERLCRPKPGQFVSVRMAGEDGRPITRCWSLSAFADTPDDYRITVRRQEGAGSAWLHRAEPGATVELRAPAGDFVLDLGAFRPILLVAAGIGITPLLAMLHAHLARGEGAAPVFLVYGARTPQEMAFRAELDALAAAHPSLHITYVFSRSDAHGGPPSRITPGLIMQVLGDLHVVLHGARIPLPWFEHEAYVCGPGGFCAAIRDALVARGANADNIAFELFTAPETEASDIETADVRFARSGVTCAWRADDDLTLLDLAEQAGVEIASDCRAGACLTCKTAVLAGETTADVGDGSALLCLARPKTETLVLDG